MHICTQSGSEIKTKWTFFSVESLKTETVIVELFNIFAFAVFARNFILIKR